MARRFLTALMLGELRRSQGQRGGSVALSERVVIMVGFGQKDRGFEVAAGVYCQQSDQRRWYGERRKVEGVVKQDDKRM